MEERTTEELKYIQSSKQLINPSIILGRQIKKNPKKKPHWVAVMRH